MLRIGMMVRKNARAAEKTGKHHITTGRIRGAGRQEVRRDDSKPRTQLENIPSLAPEDGNPGPLPREWIALPRNGLDQCRLAAAIRSQDADVLPAGDFQINVAQGLTVTTHHRHMRKGEQGRWGHTVILTERRRDARGPPNPMGGSGEEAGARNKKEVKTASLSPPGVGGVLHDNTLCGSAACPARQVCGLTRDCFCNSLGDSPPKSLSFCGL